jgi:hypothetical protein
MNAPGEQLILRLWETLAEKGVGGLLRPWQTRREGRAAIDMKREEMIVLAQTEQDIARIRQGEVRVVSDQGVSRLIPVSPHDAPGSQPFLLAGAAERTVVADAARKEVNVARAVLYAEEALADDPSDPSGSRVSEDWLFRWRERAGEVSADELSELWGRVLAGEVKAPGRFSLRSLEVLRNLSRDEAELISKLARFIIHGCVYRGGDELLSSEGVTFDDLLELQQIGILSGVEALEIGMIFTSSIKEQFLYALGCHDQALVCRGANPELELKFECYKLTSVGKQIMRLVGKAEPHLAYLQAVGTHLKKQGVTVTLADCEPIEDHALKCFNERGLWD